MHKLPIKLTKTTIDNIVPYLWYMWRTYECKDITDFINSQNMNSFCKKLSNKKENIRYKNSKQNFSVSFDLNECIALIYFINKFTTTLQNHPYESIVLTDIRNEIIKQITYMMDMDTRNKQYEQSIKLLAA